MDTELQSLTNFADSLALKVVAFNFCDKRKKPKYCLMDGGTSISPVLSYDNLNYFMLGYLQGIK